MRKPVDLTDTEAALIRQALEYLFEAEDMPASSLRVAKKADAKLVEAFGFSNSWGEH